MSDRSKLAAALQKQRGEPESEEGARKLRQIQRMLKEQIAVEDIDSTFTSSVLRQRPWTQDELVAFHGTMDLSVPNPQTAIEAFETASQRDSFFAVPNDLYQLKADGTKEMIDKDRKAQSKRKCNLAAFMSLAGYSLQSFRIRFFLPVGAPETEDEIELADELGIPLPSTMKTDADSYVEEARKIVLARFEAYLKDNDLLVAHPDVEHVMYSGPFTFVDARVMPREQVQAICARGKHGLHHLAYMNGFFTEADVRHGAPDWRLTNTVFFDKKMTTLLTRFLGFKDYCGDGYALYIPAKHEADTVAAQYQDIFKEDCPDPEGARALGEEREHEVCQFRMATLDKETGAPDTFSKGTLLPLDRELIQKRLSETHRMAFELRREAEETDDPDLFEYANGLSALMADIGSFLYRALRKDASTTFMVIDDQTKIGSDHVKSGQTRTGLLVGTVLRGLSDDDDIGTARFRMRGGSQQLMNLSSDAYGDILRHLDRGMSTLEKQIRTPYGLAGLISEGALADRKTLASSGAPVEMNVSGDMLNLAIRSGLIRLDQDGAEQLVQGKEVERGHLQMPKPTKKLVDNFVSHQARNILRSFNIKFPTFINRTGPDRISDWVHACGLNQTRVYTSEGRKDPYAAPAGFHGPEPTYSGPETFSSFSKLLTRMLNETTYTRDIHIRGGYTDHDPEPVSRLRQTPFLPKTVAGQLNADDDGDLVGGIVAIRPVCKARIPVSSSGRPRFRTVELFAKVILNTRYPQVDAPPLWVVPAQTPTPWDSQPLEDEWEARGHTWRAGKLSAGKKTWRTKPPIDGRKGAEHSQLTLDFDAFGTQNEHINSYLNIFRPELPFGTDLNGYVQLCQSPRFERLSDTGAKPPAKVIKRPVDHKNTMWLLNRVMKLNRTGSLTRNLERFHVLHDKAKHDLARPKKLDDFPDEQYFYAMREYRQRAFQTMLCIEAELTAIKKDVRIQKSPFLSLWEEDDVYGLMDNQEVRDAIPLKYHTLLRSMNGISNEFPGRNTLESLSQNGITGWGKESAALDACIRGRKLKSGRWSGRTGLRLVRTIESIETNLATFVTQVGRRLPAKPTLAMKREAKKLRGYLEAWVETWAAHWEEREASVTMDPSRDNLRLWKERTSHLSSGLKLYMQAQGDVASDEALIICAYLELKHRSKSDRDGADNITALLALLSRRIHIVFPLGSSEAPIHIREARKTLQAFARTREAKRPLPGLIGSFVPGKIRYNAEEDLFTLHHDGSTWALHIADHSTVRPKDGAQISFFRRADWSGILRFSRTDDVAV